MRDKKLESLTLRVKVAEAKNAEYEKQIREYDKVHAYTTKMLVQAMMQREQVLSELELIKAQHTK